MESTATLFVEYPQAMKCIAALTESVSVSPSSSSPSALERNEALTELRHIFDKYLECPTLLDPYLEQMVSTLSEFARSRMHSSCSTTAERKYTSDVDLCLSHTLSALYAISKVRGRKHVQRFLPHEARDVEPVFFQLQSLSTTSKRNGTNNDNGIHDEDGAVQPWESVHVLWMWMGTLSLVPFGCLVLDSNFNSSIPTTGTDRSIIDDSSLNTDKNNSKDGGLVESLVRQAKDALSDAGSTRETAASCLASWLSRPDLERTELQAFVNWSDSVLESALKAELNNTFLVIGVMQTLVTIIKISVDRSNIIKTMEQQLWERALLLSEHSCAKRSILLRKLLVKWFARMGCSYLPPKVASWRYQRGRRSLLENMTMPVCNDDTNNTHTAKQPTNQNADHMDHINTTETITVDHSHDDISKDDFKEVYGIIIVPDEVEDAMGHLIHSALTDPTTVVRWSAAKGIGRLTERLPALCAHDVLDAILERSLLLDNKESRSTIDYEEKEDHAWHGACLTLAELARRGLLLPSRLSDVVPLVVRAIQYDVCRTSNSTSSVGIGTHVRDAACYTYWAFARAYAPSDLKPYMSQLSESIVLTSLFDREVNCRRAASAAFQECVGRQGADNFKHGISILTVADYFTLGNRNDSFTRVAYHVAQFSVYQKPIIQHLYKAKLCHWDHRIRTLASKSLNGLTVFNTNFMAQIVVPFLLDKCIDDSLFVRHGALLGLAEIILALGVICDKNEDKHITVVTFISETTLSIISELVPAIEKARLYRGRGGEIMRSSVCRFIECISLAKLPLTVRHQVRLLDTIDICLKHPSEDIQEHSSKALGALLQTYFPVGKTGPSARLQSRVVDKYIAAVQTDENPAVTRGFALALGYLPKKLLAPSFGVLQSVLCCLCNASNPDSKVGGEGDAETRRNATISLSKICITVGAGSYTHLETVVMSQEQVAQVFEALLLAMKDYNTDRRGDVGSWSRIAAMSGLEDLTHIAVKQSVLALSLDEVKPSTLGVCHEVSSFTSNGTNDTKGGYFFDKTICVRVIGAFLKQISEKLDAVRLHAGECLGRMLMHENPPIPFISNHPLLLDTLGLNRREGDNLTNWANAAHTFPMMMAAANIDDFFPSIISGLVISVGGLTESVTKHANKALLDWCRGPGSSVSCATKLGTVILELFAEHSRDSRVILPLLKTVDTLLSHGCLDILVEKPESGFAKSLFFCLKAEARSCSGIHRLFAIVNVALGLLNTPEEALIQVEIFPFVFKMLVHRFPRVCRYTAEQLYIRLLEDSSMISDPSHLEGAMELLLGAPWDSDQDHASLVEVRNKVADMIGVSLSSEVRMKSPARKASNAKDDEFNYGSLVSELGL